MADDIQIKSSQAGGSSGSSASIPAPPTEGSAVIDLRNMTVNTPAPQAAPITPVPQAGTPSALPAIPAAPVPQAPPAAPTPQNRPQSFNLEEAAMQASALTVAAPPEKYAVPDLVKQKFPDLIQLIKETESMNDEERDYWFQILPIMTEEQIQKFRDILLNEKSQLSKLDKEYESELTKLNEKHMIEWKEFESKEKRKALTEAEKAANVKEQATEEELLSRLSNI